MRSRLRRRAETNICSNDWNESDRSRNGFIFTELIVAALIASVLIPVFLSAAAQVFRFYYDQSVREDLSQQENGVDESLYIELRYARDIILTDNTIRFTSVSGLSAGFTVQNGILYRILDDNTRQPLTGSGGIGHQNIKIVPYHDAPYFSGNSSMIRIAMILQHDAGSREQLCIISVSPLYSQWEGI